MSSKPPPTSQLLALGVAQAVLFIVGALLGRWIGMLLGFDAFASAGYGGKEMFGIALIGLGGGAGLHIARAWHRRKYGDPRS